MYHLCTSHYSLCGVRARHRTVFSRKYFPNKTHTPLSDWIKNIMKIIHTYVCIFPYARYSLCSPKNTSEHRNKIKFLIFRIFEFKYLLFFFHFLCSSQLHHIFYFLFFIALHTQRFLMCYLSFLMSFSCIGFSISFWWILVLVLVLNY